MAKLLDFPVVLVLWKDAWGDTTDTFTARDAQDHEPVVMQDVGFLVGDTPEGVTLAMEGSRDFEGFRGSSFIPRGMLVEIVYLAPRRKLKVKLKCNSTTGLTCPEPQTP